MAAAAGETHPGAAAVHETRPRDAPPPLPPPSSQVSSSTAPRLRAGVTVESCAKLRPAGEVLRARVCLRLRGGGSAKVHAGSVRGASVS